MCLVLFAHRVRADDALILLANRDEFHARPTSAAQFWPDAPDVLAGRDLSAGGTWLGVTRDARFAAVTNYREGLPDRSWPRSRGELVADYLRGNESAVNYLAEVQDEAAEYAPFNLLVGDRQTLWHFSNQTGKAVEVAPGVHGLSNHLLNTHWPKVTRGSEALESLLQGPARPDPESLLAILADERPVADQCLPDTGVGIDWERRLSTIFIRGSDYGTRSSTLIRIDGRGGVEFVERSFGPDGVGTGEVRHCFDVDAVATG